MFKEIPFNNHYLINQDGLIMNRKTNRILKQNPFNGYKYVRLKYDSNTRLIYKISDLVNQVFLDQ